MNAEDLCYLGIAEAGEKFRAREVSPVELGQAHLDRIQALDGQLNAYITVLGERALEQARAAERAFASGAASSPLLGVPIAVKDLVYTKGIRTTAGSKILADFEPDYDATVVERLEGAGAVLLGKLNLMEFAMGGTYTNVHYGSTNNPWDIERFPGGSSSGAGASVASGLAMGALGSDTGGSIRGPAHNCGIVGLKPTFGRVSRRGVVPLSWSLDHVGPMTRTVEDCAMMLQAIAGHDPQDPFSSEAPVGDYTGQLRDGVRGLRIGVMRADFFDGLLPEVSSAIESALGVFTELGATTRDVAVQRVTEARTIYQAIVYPEATAYHGPWMRSRIEEYGPNCRTRLEAGLGILATQYVQAQRERRILVEEFNAALEGVDVLIAPTSHRTAPRFDEEAAENAAGSATPRQYTSPLDLTGHPALVLPIGFGDGGLPITLQIIGRAFDEATVLRAAYAYEQATRWYTRHPQF